MKLQRIASVLLLVLFTHSLWGKINIGIEQTTINGADNRLNIYYTATTDYSVLPFSFWNSQLFTMRWSTSLGSEVIRSISNEAAYSFVLDGLPADGGDGFYYQKFTSSSTAVIQSIPIGTSLDVLTIVVSHPSIESGDFELVTDPNPWVVANFGKASVNAGVGGEQFNVFSPSIAVGVALPVDLLDFTATAVERQIHLRWNTANEIDLAGYEVQRAADINNRLFRPITFQSASGRQNASYALLDREVLPDRWYYYRLKMLDLDGAYSYSPVRAAKIDASSGSATAILYPNPTETDLQLEFQAHQAASGQIVIRDLQGREMMRTARQWIVGWNRAYFQLGSWPAGQYVLSIQSDQGFQQHLRFTKIRP